MLDAMRYKRTDGALARALALPKEGNIEQIEAEMQDFILQFTPTLIVDYFSTGGRIILRFGSSTNFPNQIFFVGLRFTKHCRVTNVRFHDVP